MKKRKNREAGQSLVEFALILPVLLLVLCGIIDFGWVFSNQLIIDFGARDGARYAAINADSGSFSSTVTTYVKKYTPVANPANLTVTPAKSGEEVSVKLSYPLPLLTPITSALLGDPFTITSICVMKAE